MSNFNPYSGYPGSSYVNAPANFDQTYDYNSYDYSNYNQNSQTFYSRSNTFNQQPPVQSQNVVTHVSNSRLTPTAQEFTPRNGVSASTGAVRKKTNNDRNTRWENKRHYKQHNNKQYGHSSKIHSEFKEPNLSLKETDIPLQGRKEKEVPKNSIKNDLSEDLEKLSVATKQETSSDGKTTEKVSNSKNYTSEPRYKNQRRDRNNYRQSEYSPKNNARYDNADGDRYNEKTSYHNRSYYQNSRNNYDNGYGYKRYNSRYDKTDRNGRYDKNERSNNSNIEGNWRSSNSKQTGLKKSTILSEQERKKKIDAASQRDRLVNMIETRILECLVCCEKVKHSDKVWSCIQCYHILHLSCVAAWAKSSKLDSGWRCPACQNVCSEVPKQYRCYCGKVAEPKHEPGVTPHSCGDICMRKGRTCDHKCVILCHPGPCPDCNVMVERRCGCGSTVQTVKCSSDVEIICENVCNKLLECMLHACKLKCHKGPCDPCSELIEQSCFCGKSDRQVPCTAKYAGSTKYECGELCEKMLACGNHKCDKLCHDGPCDMCVWDVSLIKTCPCGKKPLENERKSCLDPIPSCNMTCGKKLKCGQPSAPHTCKEICHLGDCPPCPLTTLVRCRCGHMDKELPCETLTTKADDARCEKKCTKKRLCGKHRCNQRCCIELEHICPLPCNRPLTCGQHRCDRTCHSGRCPPCIEASFEELYCECGASVLYPPIPCGTKPPLCDNPCTRPRLCGHEANHNCHTGPCPPCTVLCKRWCYGKHEERSAIPCHQEDFSCGLPCGRPMSCGRHRCIKPCHQGNCPQPCRQPCTVERLLCGHPCNAPCHEPPCPETTCKQLVPVTCQCGLQKSTRPCTDLTEEFRNIEMAQLRDKLVEKDQPIDISDILNKPRKPSVLKILECTDECRIFERNRKLAIGLQIRNPDLSQKLTPRFSDYMRSWAKKDHHFCQRIHNKLTELVQLAKQSKQKSRSFSFESMNRDKRHFIHEYCEHFGCESAAYDMEPNRNVVATAFKDKSWLPSMSLLEVIQRENGQRKVPGPVITKGTPGKSESVTSLRLPGRIQRPATPPGEYVDYFDDPAV